MTSEDNAAKQVKTSVMQLPFSKIQQKVLWLMRLQLGSDPEGIGLKGGMGYHQPAKGVSAHQHYIFSGLLHITV